MEAEKAAGPAGHGRKRIHADDSARSRAKRKRDAENGGREMLVCLSPEAWAGLQKIAAPRAYSAAIERLILEKLASLPAQKAGKSAS